jgi:hypothetical protein
LTGLLVLLESKKGQILERWKELVLSIYPGETRRFLDGSPDRFGNPAGFIITETLEKIVDGLAGDLSPEALEPVLTDMIKVFAVQDLPASRVLKFLFYLKRVLRETLEKDTMDGKLFHQFLDMQERIDELTLRAFDIFCRCREQVAELKVNQFRAERERIVRLLKSMKKEGARRDEP